jgi:hypothetical protein
MSNHDETEPFLARWSRRKRELAADKQPAGATPAPAASPAVPVDAPVETMGPRGENAEASLAEPPETEPPLDLSKLPRIEDLTADTDITAFLDSRVPASLRNAVLNRMWSLDPTIRDFIEVAELQWDWNTPGGAPFYEVIEPGSAASTIIADATSAISRAIRGEPETTGLEVAAAGEPESASQQIEKTPLDHLAAHNPSQPDPAATALAEGEPIDNSPNVAQATPGHIAPQQSLLQPLPPHRRHGGALPT